MVFAFLKSLFEPPASVSKAPVPAAPPQLYKLFAVRCQVVMPPERYRRPNADGSHYFEGTTLQVRTVPEGNSASISCEGLFGIADKANVLDVVYAPYEIEMMNLKSSLPVLVLNNNTSGYHLIEENIGKCGNKHGRAELRAEIAQYAQRNLKVTFA